MNLDDLETKARAADAMDVYDPGTDYDYQMATRPEQILKLIAVVRAAQDLKQSGGSGLSAEFGMAAALMRLFAALAALELP